MKRAFAAAGVLAAALALTGTAATAGTDTTLGPHGYKGLQIGQTTSEAEATGLLVDKQVNGGCTRYYLNPSEGKQNPGSGVWVDQKAGVVLIGGTDRAHTPEGITMGSTLDQVRKAYPALKPVPPQDFVYDTAVPGHPELRYRFAVDEHQRVSDYDVNTGDIGACG